MIELRDLCYNNAQTVESWSRPTPISYGVKRANSDGKLKISIAKMKMTFRKGNLNKYASLTHLSQSELVFNLGWTAL